MAYHKRTLLPIGIHLSADAVHMVQLEQAETGVNLVSKAAGHFTPAAASPTDPGSRSVAPDAAYAQAWSFVREKVTTNGFRGRDAVVSLPAEYLVIQYVRMAPSQPEELTGILMSELKGKLPFDPQEAVIRHLVAGAVSDNNEMKQDVIVLAARRAVVERQVNALQRMGLRVVGVGVEPCAMCYPYTFAALHTPAETDAPVAAMMVHLGSHATHVAIVRGQETNFVKGLDLGTNHLVTALADSRKISFEAAAALRAKWRDTTGVNVPPEAIEAYNSVSDSLEYVVDEIESCMRYYASLARGAHINRVVFLGPEARDRALVQVIGAHVGTRCEVGHPLGTVVAAVAHTEPEPELATAVGLSLFPAE